MKIKCILSYLVIYIVWGSTYYFIRLGVESMPPFYLVGTRFFIGGAAFVLLSLFSGVLTRRPSRQELLSALIMGLLLLLLGNGLVSVAQQTVDSYLAAIIVASTPFCVAAFNRALFGENLATFRLTGMISGLAGVILILYNGRSFASSFTPGVFIVFGGLFCWSLATSIGHRMKVHPNTLVNSGLQMLFAGTIGLLIAQLLYAPLPALLPSITLRSWIGCAYLTVFGGVAFYCYSYLLKHEPSIRVVSYAIINPLIAVLIGIFVGKEKSTPLLFLGMPLILVGLVLMLYGGRIFGKVKDRFRDDVVDVG